MVESVRLQGEALVCFLLQFLVSLLLCLLDWCMALPAGTLLHPVSTAALDEQAPARAPLLDYIYRVSPPATLGLGVQGLDWRLRQSSKQVAVVQLLSCV